MIDDAQEGEGCSSALPSIKHEFVNLVYDSRAPSIRQRQFSGNKFNTLPNKRMTGGRTSVVSLCDQTVRQENGGTDRLFDMMNLMDEALTQRVQSWQFSLVFEALCWPGAVCFSYRGLLVFLPAIYICIGNDGFIHSLLALAFGHVCACSLKVFIQRPRPPSPLAKHGVVRHMMVKKPSISRDPDSFSFPSGDTTTASVLGGVLAISTGFSCFLLLGPWAAFGRVYWWCHWMSDVLGGMSVGFFASYFIYLIAKDALTYPTVMYFAFPYGLVMLGIGYMQSRAYAKYDRR